MVVDAGRNASAGHAALEPVQASAASQVPATPRHTEPAVTKPLAGQAAPEPPQVSATSHTPADGRHVVPAATLPQVVGPGAPG